MRYCFYISYFFNQGNFCSAGRAIVHAPFLEVHSESDMIFFEEAIRNILGEDCRVSILSFYKLPEDDIDGGSAVEKFSNNVVEFKRKYSGTDPGTGPPGMTS